MRGVSEMETTYPDVDQIAAASDLDLMESDELLSAHTKAHPFTQVGFDEANERLACHIRVRMEMYRRGLLSHDKRNPRQLPLLAKE